MDEAQRRALRGSALGSLVRQHRSEHLGGAELEVTDLGFGAAVAPGDRAFVLIDGDADRAVGPALLWAERAGARSVELWARAGAADLARRVRPFRDPPAVWAVRDRQLDAVEAAPPPSAPDVPDEAWPFAALLREGGATVVDDHGVLVGEFEGLEVARVVAVGGEAWLEVGVGQADREFEQAFHRDQSSVQRIRRVIEIVARHRRDGAPPHPLNRLGRERWLRARLLADPGLVGAASLTPAPPLRARQGLTQHLPAPAVGVDPDGRPVVVVAAVGIDLDLVPEAADLRQRHDPDARLVIVVPPRDRIAPLERLVARLDRATLCPAAPPWSAG